VDELQATSPKVQWMS